MLQLYCLEVDNFKSYVGKGTIGPFESFTSVIGPNGSGKSNLMDGLSFCLTSRASKMRGQNLKELINESATNASVTAIFRNLDTDEESRFQRKLNKQAASSYSINGVHVSVDDYHKKLEANGISPKKMNFLVYQGEVESFAYKNPGEYTQYLENVSTSKQLVDDYGKAKLRLTGCQDTQADVLQKKKGAKAEQKQIENEKKEADKYKAFEKERDELKRQLHLFNLFLLDNKLDSYGEEREKIEENLALESERLRKQEEEVEALKKEHVSAKKEGALILDKFRKTEKSVRAIQGEIDLLKEQIKHHEDARNKLMKKFKAQKKIDEDSKEQIRILKESKAEVEKDKEEFEESVKKPDNLVELENQNMNEYLTLKEKSSNETMKHAQKIRHAERIQESCKRDLDMETTRCSEIESNLSQRKETYEKQKARQVKLVDYIESTRNDLKAVEEKAKAQKARRDQNNTKMQDAERALDEVNAKLRSAKSDSRQNSKEEKFLEAVETLRRLFGIRGVISDLVRPTQEKYNVVMQVVFGKHMNSIIVDDSNTARECIQYLKENKLCTATFLPLDSVKFKPINESYRTLSGAKMAVDVIEYEESINRAIYSICGNTIVCDTLAEARAICFGTRERYKCVTVDGTLIDKSGTMTGGSSGLKEKAKSWSMERLKSLKAKHKDVISALKKEAARDEREDYISEEASLQTRLQNAKSDYTAVGKTIKSLEGKIAQLEKSLADQKALIKQHAGKVLEADADLEKLESEKDFVVDRVFANFCKKLNIDNIRQYEGDSLRKTQETNKKRAQFQSMLGKLDAELEYEATRKTGEKCKKIEMDIEKKDTLIEDEGAKMEKEERKLGAVEEEMKDLQEKHSEASKNVKAKALEAKKKQEELSKAKGTLDELTNKLDELNVEIERFQDEKTSLVKECLLEEIDIPFMDNELSLEDTQDIDADVEIDYDDLNDNLRTREDKKKVEAEYKEKIRKKDEELDSLSPNFKAYEKLDSVNERLKDADLENENALSELEDAKHVYEKLRDERESLFNEIFNHVKSKIDSIYKELTGDGSADLLLESEEEPYLHGIKYTAQPPGKNFREMSDLSGGEKTVAALAMLFAIQSFKPRNGNQAPFFILDEVDAALDANNVDQVAKFIQKKSKEFQCIVISLKDSFYSMSDSIVGVYNDSGASKTLTLDLTKYDDQSMAA